jgi:hypothetical protein
MDLWTFTLQHAHMNANCASTSVKSLKQDGDSIGCSTQNPRTRESTSPSTPSHAEAPIISQNLHHSLDYRTNQCCALHWASRQPIWAQRQPNSRLTARGNSSKRYTKMCVGRRNHFHTGNWIDYKLSWRVTRARRCVLGEGLKLRGIAEVRPSAVEEEAEAVDSEQVAQGTLPVRPTERRHLHRSPHLIW